MNSELSITLVNKMQNIISNRIQSGLYKEWTSKHKLKYYDC